MKRRFVCQPDISDIGYRIYRGMYIYRVHLFLKGVPMVCHGHGFLVTAYPTDAIKEGECIWPR